MASSTTTKGPARFTFLMLDEFTMISLAAAIEPLRMANRILRTEQYHWKMVSRDGAPVIASDGLSVAADCSIADPAALTGCDLLMVCGGIHIQQRCERTLLKWLRSAAARGIPLGAICTGSHVLAQAGLLDGYDCSIHWENSATLSESFPKVTVSGNVFTFDRNRYTCTGGTAPIDMMLSFICEDHGVGVAAEIADQFICDRVRRGDDKQRIPLRHIVGQHSGKLLAAVELMEANLREPIEQDELAAYVALSRRQLQRLFRKYLFCAPSRYYLQLRLRRSRELLQQTGLSVLEVSSLCGFVSASHFSQSYKDHFGFSPSQERQR